MDALALSELDSSIEKNFSLVVQLALVTNKIDLHILSSMLLDFLQPTSEVVKSLVSCDIISQEDTVSSFIEDSCHRLKGFLTSRVPNLKLNHLFVNLHSICSKFNTNRDLMLLLELIVNDSLHETTLSHSSVSNND